MSTSVSTVHVAKGRLIISCRPHVSMSVAGPSLVYLYMSVPLPVYLTLRVYPLSVRSVTLLACSFAFYLSVCLSVWPFVCLSLNLSLCQFFFLSVTLPVCPSVCLSSVSMSVPLSVLLSKDKTPVTLGLHVCLSVCSLCLFICYSTCLSLYFLPVCPSACHILPFCSSNSICSLIPHWVSLYLYAVCAPASCLYISSCRSACSTVYRTVPSACPNVCIPACSFLPFPLPVLSFTEY